MFVGVMRNDKNKMDLSAPTKVAAKATVIRALLSSVVNDRRPLLPVAVEMPLCDAIAEERDTCDAMTRLFEKVP